VFRRCGKMRGTMSWHSGMGLDRASSLSRTVSLRSPAGKRYFPLGQIIALRAID